MKKMLSIEDAGLGYANKEYSYLEIAKETPGGDRVEKIATGRTEEKPRFLRGSITVEIEKAQVEKKLLKSAGTIIKITQNRQKYLEDSPFIW